ARWKIPTVYCISCAATQCPARPITSRVHTRRGRKLMVCSLIWVAAWNRLTSTPTTMLGTISTSTSRMIRRSAPIASSATMSGLMPLYPLHAGDQGVDRQRPAVHQHEQQQLERQRYHQRREHHHAHRH